MTTYIDDAKIRFDEQASAPATPATGKVIIYAKTDGKVYRKDDTGAEAELGGGTFTSIASGDLSGVASATISSIPATYSQLVLYIYAKSQHASADTITIRVGAGSVDTSATSYARSSINVTGTTVTGTGDTGSVANIVTNCPIVNSSITLRYSSTIITFPDYTATSTANTAHYTHRASLGPNVADQIFVVGGANWLNSTSAINTIGISTVSGSNFSSGSEYVLYGIKGS